MSHRITRFLLIAALTLLSASAVLAHAKLVSSSPSKGQVLSLAPASIELNFSVGVQSKMSAIVVTGPSGDPVPVGQLTESDGAKQLSVSLPPLEPGSYKVVWKALSADDHMIGGEFDFRIDATATAAATDPSPQVDHADMDHSAHEAEPSINWPQSIVRWPIYIGMMLLTGGIGFRLFVLRDIVLRDTFDTWLRTILILSAALVLIGLLFSLVLQTNSVTGTFGIENATSVIGQTSFGPPWLLQIVSSTLALLLILFGRYRKVLFPLAFGLSLLCLLGPSLSGHARAAWDDYSFAILSDWLHLVAAAAWIGGLFVIGFALTSAFESSASLHTVIGRFTQIAIPATILLAVTGLYNTWIHVDGLSSLVGTTYGQVLILKVGIFAVMVVLGGINGFRIQPQLREDPVSTSGDRLLRNVKLEVGLAVVVLLLAAILAYLPPAREHPARTAIETSPVQEAR
jgi:copper transport protein